MEKLPRLSCVRPTNLAVTLPGPCPNPAERSRIRLPLLTSTASSLASSRPFPFVSRKPAEQERKSSYSSMTSPAAKPKIVSCPSL
jgi:hypothetical protein